MQDLLNSLRDNIGQKERFIDELLTENVQLKKEVEALKETIKTWILLAENVRRYAP